MCSAVLNDSQEPVITPDGHVPAGLLLWLQQIQYWCIVRHNRTDYPDSKKEQQDNFKNFILTDMTWMIDWPIDWLTDCLQGYYRQDEFIVTQSPTEGTIERFWHMVWQYNVRTVVLLCEIIQPQATHPDQQVGLFGNVFGLSFRNAGTVLLYA